MSLFYKDGAQLHMNHSSGWLISHEYYTFLRRARLIACRGAVRVQTIQRRGAR